MQQLWSGYAYILAPKGAAVNAALTGDFLQRRMREYETLKAEIESLEQETEARVSKPQDGS
ncbi:MAG: hypothetical protein KF904_07375 [Rhodoblastus sp.]|nr:hypothetical protein [Rhodoblastus sp.]